MSSARQFTTIDEAVRWRAQQTPDRLAVEFQNGGERRPSCYTYAELDRQARSIAGILSRRRLRGERALLLYDHAEQFLPGFLGCLYAGVNGVPIFPPRNRRSLPRVAAIAGSAGAVAALSSVAVLDRVRGNLLSDAKLAEVEWVLTDAPGLDAAADWSGPLSRGDDLAFLQYTSGSTGDPKGAMISHDNVLHNSACIARHFGHDANSRMMTWLPFYHDMGLIGCLLHPLIMGMPLLHMPFATFVQRPVRWLQAISAFGATTSGGPNFAYELCAEKITDEECSELDLSSWQVAFNGAEPVRAATLKKFGERFQQAGFRPTSFYPCYGMAETTLLLAGGPSRAMPTTQAFDMEALKDGQAIASANGAEKQLVGCGRPIDDQRVLVVDPDTRVVCPPTTIGEIWTTGPSVTRGYWNNRVATAEAFAATPVGATSAPDERWLRTGDLGFECDGELFITGRHKDVLIVRGKNHYPHDIEATVETAHQALQLGGSAAFSVDDGEWEQVVVAAEIRREAWRTVPAEDVVADVRRAVAEAHQCHVSTVVLLRPATLPKTSSGKVQRRKCRQLFLDQSLSVLYEETHMSSNTPPTHLSITTEAWQDIPQRQRRQEIIVDLKRTLAEMTQGDPCMLDSDQSIRDLGLDSMQFLQLKLHVDDRLGREFDLDRFLTLPTIGQLAQWCDEDLSAESTVDPAGESVRQQKVPDNKLLAPGPPDSSDAENLARFNDDFFGYLLELTRRYGELVRFRWGNQQFHMIINPDDIKEVFVSNQKTYRRGAVWSPFKAIMGDDGLITTDGDRWRQQRTATRPAFSQQSQAVDAAKIEGIVNRYLTSLRQRVDNNEAMDFMTDMKRITMQVIMKKLVAAEDADARVDRLLQTLLPLDDLWNVPSQFIAASNPGVNQMAAHTSYEDRYRQVMESLDPLVFSFVDEHLADPNGVDDVLRSLMGSEVYQSLPSGRRRQFLRDSAVTTILTGFDTTSAALFWTIHLLSKHREACETLCNELDQASPKGTDPQSVTQLPYLQAVIHESLRMYPPVWYVGREVAADTTLRGFHIPRGSFVLASPFVVHRNPWVWSDPSAFRPERFLKSEGPAFNTPGYMPFGSGPRFCIGRPLAMLEIAIVISRLFREFTITSDAPQQLELLTAFTLRPREAVAFHVQRRREADALMRPAEVATC